MDPEQLHTIAGGRAEVEAPLSDDQEAAGARIAAALYSLAASPHPIVQSLLQPFHGACQAGRAAAVANLPHLHLDRCTEGHPWLSAATCSALAAARGATALTLSAQQLQQLGELLEAAGTEPVVASSSGSSSSSPPTLQHAVASSNSSSTTSSSSTTTTTITTASSSSPPDGCSSSSATSCSSPAVQTHPAAAATPAAAAPASSFSGLRLKALEVLGFSGQHTAALLQLLAALPQPWLLQQLSIRDPQQLQCRHLPPAPPPPTAVAAESPELPANKGLYWGACCAPQLLSRQSTAESMVSCASSESEPDEEQELVPVAALGQLKQLSVHGNSAWPHQLQPLLLQPLAPQLQVVQLCGLQLQQLPQELAAAGQLTQLMLQDNWDAVQAKAGAGQQLGQLVSCSSLKHLDLAGNYLAALPEDVSNLSGLTALQLQHNLLAGLPSGASKLCKLQRLGLQSNRLTGLCAAITGLTSLRQLDLQSNRLRQLPDSISALVQLSHLDVSRNALEQLLDGISCLVSLQQLNLSSNQLEELPDALSGCSQLQVLDAGSNSLTAIPSTLSKKLRQLRELNLSNNELREDLDISGWDSLQDLDLSSNWMNPYPSSIFTLGGLTRLDLRSTSGRALPEELTALTALQVLVVEDTHTSRVPVSLTSCTALKHLELSCGGWYFDEQHLPKGLTCLSGLTQLRFGPKDIGNGSSSYLERLPKGMEALTHLVVLDISCLSSVKDWEWLGELSHNLQQLRACRMNWSKLPAVLPQLTALTSLQLQWNDLTDLPEHLTALTGLQQLQLSSNSLAEVPACLAALPHLMMLDMSSNPLAAGGSKHPGPTQLQELDLSDCKAGHLVSLVRSTGLTKLVLRSNGLVALQGSSKLPPLPLLKQLDLSDNRLRHLKGLGPMPQLEVLDLSSNHRLTSLTGLGLLGGLQSLQKLSLRGIYRRAGHPGRLAALAGLGVLPQLWELDLGHNQLVCLPPEVWSWLQTLPRLQVLCLSMNSWPPELGLWESPQLLQLRLLDLSWGNLRALPTWLLGLPRLEVLLIQGNGGLDDVQAAEVLQELPAVKQVSAWFDLPPQLQHVKQTYKDYEVLVQQLMEEGQEQQG